MDTLLKTRIASIDVMRAITMVLMIFVNDLSSIGRGAIYTDLDPQELGSLTNIPLWLGHVKAGVDGMGLADIIFPSFLFIVGMSIPFAIQNRRHRLRDSNWTLVKIGRAHV